VAEITLAGTLEVEAFARASFSNQECSSEFTAATDGEAIRESVSSTRRATLVSSSRWSCRATDRLVEFAFFTGKRVKSFDDKGYLQGGFVHPDHGRASEWSGAGDRFADVTYVNAGHSHQITGAGIGDLDPLQPSKPSSLLIRQSVIPVFTNQ